jgi:hypothetical protein
MSEEFSMYAARERLINMRVYLGGLEFVSLIGFIAFLVITVIEEVAPPIIVAGAVGCGILLLGTHFAFRYVNWQIRRLEVV